MNTIFDKDTWQEIFGSISQNKLRTLITIIGVLWGIFLYIVLSGIAKGVDNGFEHFIHGDKGAPYTDGLSYLLREQVEREDLGLKMICFSFDFLISNV